MPKFWQFSAFGGPQRAPGPSKIGPGRKTGPGEGLRTSRDPLGPRIEKNGARGSLGPVLFAGFRRFSEALRRLSRALGGFWGPSEERNCVVLSLGPARSAGARPRPPRRPARGGERVSMSRRRGGPIGVLLTRSSPEKRRTSTVPRWWGPHGGVSLILFLPPEWEWASPSDSFELAGLTPTHANTPTPPPA